jgi:hypothetical protein
LLVSDGLRALIMFCENLRAARGPVLDGCGHR